ncbi:MAG: hypothetical protein HRT38_04155 [Alteromonadaceae bacterium]|nr:hypothetical protein [Alteromonadaceae bacterium]
MKNYCPLLASLFLLSATQSFAIESTNTRHIHVMKKGDTLWGLSARYFNNPGIWANITEIDGSPVADVYKIPIGHKVLLQSRPKKILHPEIGTTKTKTAQVQQKTNQLQANISSVNPFVKSAMFQASNSITDPAVRKMVSRIESNQTLFLTKSTGLIRAYWNGEYVTIPVKTIVKHLKQQIPNVEEVVLATGVYIDKKLISQLLGLKK